MKLSLLPMIRDLLHRDKRILTGGEEKDCEFYGVYLTCQGGTSSQNKPSRVINTKASGTSSSKSDPLNESDGSIIYS